MIPGRHLSTLADVIRSVRDQFVAANISTEILLGENHLEEEGAANRVVFVPGDGGGEMAPQRLSTGGVARLEESCTAYVWGYTNSADDFDRYDAAYAILANVIVAVNVAAPGRITMTALRRSQESRIVTYGEEYQIVFTYQWQVNKGSALSPLPGSIVTSVSSSVEG